MERDEGVEKLDYLPPIKKAERRKRDKLKPLWRDAPKPIVYKVGVTREV